MSDSIYTIPCHKSQVHPDGICRKKLHGNISKGFHRLSQRIAEEEMQEQMAQQKAQFDEQRRQIDIQEKMMGVGMGTHRVIKDNRKNKPMSQPFLPGAGGKPNNTNKGKQK